MSMSVLQHVPSPRANSIPGMPLCRPPQDLVRQLRQTLFEAGSPEAAKVKVTTSKNTHIVLTGGHWRNAVVSWLQAKGF
jgi:hypothetical protein